MESWTFFSLYCVSASETKQIWKDSNIKCVVILSTSKFKENIEATKL